MNDEIKKDQALVAAIASSDVSVWSEERQNEFVTTFKARSNAARYILAKTAEIIFNVAERRKFVSGRHRAKAFGNFAGLNQHAYMTEQEKLSHRHDYYLDVTHIGGRLVAELDQIAAERAEEVLRNLPPLKEAINIIDPETSKKLARLEVLQKKGQKLAEELDTLGRPIVISELPETMTLGEFRAQVKALEKRRRDVLDQLSDIGEEGTPLEEQVNKRLYSGIPGLTDAVCKVVLEHLERSAALDATTRRVEEQVKFGDNEAALSMLSYFEKDERTVSESVAESFRSALEKLKIARKSPKKLTTKKAEKVEPETQPSED